MQFAVSLRPRNRYATKMKKSLLIITAFAILLPGICHDSRAEGGGDFGGANGINYQIVEDFKKDDKHEICGYDEYLNDLEQLRNTLPGLATTLEKSVQHSVWYKIPEDIRELPESTTGLHFSTQQLAFQPPSGGEVFIDGGKLEKACAIDKKRAGRMLMHEAIMTLQTNKDGSKVRKVVDKIYAKKPDPKEIQIALAENDFGAYFTADQYQLLKQGMRSYYLYDMKAKLERAQQECKSPGPAAQSLKNILRGLRNFLFNEADDPSADSTYDVPLDQVEGLGFEPNLSHWLPPFEPNGGRSVPSGFGLVNEELWSDCRFGKREVDDPVVPVPVFSQEVCKEILSHKLTRPDDLDEKTFPEENAVRFAARRELYRSLNESVINAVVLPFKEELARNNTFLTLMAFSLGDDYHVDREFFPDISDDRRRVKEIAVKAMARRKDLDFHKPAAIKKLICSSIDSLKTEVDKKAEKEDQKVKALRYPSANKDTTEQSAVELSPSTVAPKNQVGPAQ